MRNPGEEKGRDEGPTGLGPPCRTIRLADVDRLESNALVAKELLGRPAGCSSLLPEESG